MQSLRSSAFTRALRSSSNLTRTTRPFSSTISSNAQGQGTSHATGGSVVPGKVQEQAPKGLEESLPNSVNATLIWWLKDEDWVSKQVHDTGSQGRKIHAKNDGEDSIVPKKIQEIVPEGLGRALPDNIHNTGDSKK